MRPSSIGELRSDKPVTSFFGGPLFGGETPGPTQEALEHLAAIIESSNDAIVSKDLNAIVRSWNAAASRIFGYTHEEIVGKSITVLIPEERQYEEEIILDRIRRGDRVEHYQTRRRHKDGTLIDVSLTISPIRNREGTIVGASKIARDITAQKAAELQLQAELAQRKAAEERLELLLQEIQHRIKNSLATVVALAGQTFKSASVDERRSFSARIEALGNAHALLTQENWDRATLREIVERSVEPFQAVDSKRIQIGGPDLEMDANKSLTLAMILHELGTNASKYGALSRDGGTISVSWNVKGTRDNAIMELLWQEQGGPTVSPPLKKGFGSKLIEGAFSHTQGRTQVDYDRSGVRCMIHVVL